MAFSERMGFRPARAALQLDAIDGPLRTAIYNAIHPAVLGQWGSDYTGFRSGYYAAELIWTDFWRKPISDFGFKASFTFEKVLLDFLMSADWYEVYDLIEFCAAIPALLVDEAEFNSVLERDMSGYRVRSGAVVPITDAVELSAIDDALAIGDRFVGARTHIADALNKLARRPDPDLRNAITEAIRGVESAARVVSGKTKATLGDALKVLETQGHIHPALKDAWLKLYGYSGDEQGLRHAMTDDVEIDFATAKYMVVSCAAFVNLLAGSV